MIALIFEEVVGRQARLRLRLGAALKQDMVSVWAVAGVLALPPVCAAALVAAVLTHTWYRQERPAGQLLHRKFFNAGNNVVSCVLAAAAFGATHRTLDSTPWAVGSTVAVVVAALTYALLNRLLATAALIAMRVPISAMLGTRDDNLIEVATLCLGALVALAIAHEPLLAVLVLAPMITLQRGAVVRELEAAATTDSKTGLLNAIAWEQIAARELERAARAGTGVAVLIVDIDRFKSVNDKYGHLAGDRVLRLVGRALAGGVREYDTVARFGGEEFVAVLPNSSASDAVLVAERLRGRVHDLRMSLVVSGLSADTDERIAVSIGVAAAPAEGVEVRDLLHLADGALYRAKSAGRNCVVLADADGEQDFRPAPAV